MIDKIYETLRFLLVSLETLILVLLFLGMQYWSDLYAAGGAILKGTDTQFLFFLIITVPVAIFIKSSQLTKEIRFPSNKDVNKHLHDWPEFWKVTYRAAFTNLLCLLSVLAAVAIFMIHKQLPDALLTFWVLLTNLPPLFAVATQYQAALKIREIVEDSL